MLRQVARVLSMRTSAPVLAAGGAGQLMNSQQKVLEFNSAMSLLRACYRSIDIKVQSRHARAFLKKRLIELWSTYSTETDPNKQRLYMDMAGSFLQALHTSNDFKPGQVVEFQLSRRVAYEQQLQEKLDNAGKVKTRRRMPKPADTT